MDIITTIKVRSFINDITKVCEKYNLMIEHEDHHGAFIIEKFNKEDHEYWFCEAMIGDTLKQ